MNSVMGRCEEKSNEEEGARCALSEAAMSVPATISFGTHSELLFV
jgi:hypothetical protein